MGLGKGSSNAAQSTLEKSPSIKGHFVGVVRALDALAHSRQIVRVNLHADNLLGLGEGFGGGETRNAPTPQVGSMIVLGANEHSRKRATVACANGKGV